MAVRAHVRAFVHGLTAAHAHDPRPAATALFTALQDDPDALARWVATVDGLRFGHGAVAMHRRHAEASPPPGIPGLDDFEALALCAAHLRLGQLAHSPDPGALQHAVHHGAQWLTNLLRMEPDFLDELLLEVAARRASDPALDAALTAQAEHIRSAAAELHAQGQQVLGGRRTVGDTLRALVGAGPNLAKGEWARWARAVVVLGLLDAKG